MVKNTTNEKNNNNRKPRSGADSDSPRTKSSHSPRKKSIKKIEATPRSRSIRQTKKVTRFNELLSSGSATYKEKILNLYLKDVNFKGAILSTFVLNGIDLQEVYLTKAKLNGTKLIKANLSKCIFKKVEMKNSDLRNSICKKCNFKETILNLSNFFKADLEGSIFEETTGLVTIFERAKLKACNFKETILDLSNFYKADLEGSIFETTTGVGTNFELANLKACNFKKTILNLSKFLTADLEGSIFEKTTVLGTNFENANLKACVFIKPGLGYDRGKLTNFKDATLDNCKTTTMQIFENKYLNNIEMVTFKNIELDPEVYGRIPVSLYNITFNNSKFKDLQVSSFITGQRNKIANVKFNNSTIIDFRGYDSDYIGVIFEKCIMEKSDFRESNIRLCNFENNILKDAKFSGSVFENTIKFNNNNMRKSIFDDVKGLSGTLFEDNNFTSSSFNGTNLSGVIFKNCNLQGCRFIPTIPPRAIGDFDQIPSDLTNAVFEKCQLQSITFQSTLGLERRNFQGQDLRRCTFIGCDLTQTIFRDCNLSECVFTNAFITDADFTGSIRENTVFDEAIGRQQNETLTNAERGIVLEGDDKIPAIYPTDVHAAFKIIKKNSYYDTISSYVNDWQTKEVSDIVISNNTFTKWVSNFLDNIINKTSVNKYKLMIYKHEIITERLNLYNYKDNIVSGSEPRISWLLFLYCTLLYVEQQIPEFQELYVTDVIMESATTYGEDGLSCDRGINERFIIKLRNTMYIMMDLPQIKNNINKVIEFNKILNTIDPTKTLPTTRDAIEAEREAPEREYIDFTVSQEMRDEWYELHSAGGSEPFNENTPIKQAIESYKNFLKKKFKYYTGLDDKDRDRYDKEMEKEINDMTKVLDINIGRGMTYLFSGGRKMRRGHGGFWEMGGAKFRILCRKIFGKTKCKKMRNTKKLKKLKRKETRRN